MAHFEVGKRVIAIKDSETKGCFRKGQVFTLLQIRESKCNCSHSIELDIGIRTAARYMCCPKCGVDPYNVTNGVAWASPTAFAPIDDSLSELTDADILYSEETVKA